MVMPKTTTGGIPVVANDVRQLIRKLSGESAFIISSHNLYEIEDICSSVIILDKGKLVASKPIADLAKREGILNLSLNKAADEELLDLLASQAQIHEVSQDPLNADKITLKLDESNMDEAQLLAQGGLLLYERSYSIP